MWEETDARCTQTLDYSGGEIGPLLTMLEQRIASADLHVRHRDALIRLRAVIEEEFVDGAEGRIAA